jgi:uncharacterized protein (TIGR02246 family)
MATRQTVLWSLTAVAAVAGAGALALAPPAPRPVAAPVAAEPAVQPAAPAEDRAEDRAAIAAALAGLRTAFEAGDAKGCAALWTGEGEYVADGGATFRGRAAVEKSYAELFAKHPKPRVTAERAGLRFVSKDAAVDEGFFSVKLDATSAAVSNRYSILLAREDGKWRIAVLREWPSDGPSVRDLEWLIGEWESARDGASVRIVYEWELNKTLIRGRYTVTRDGETTTGLQLFAKDPATGRVAGWTFDGSGGVGTAAWVRNGNQWTIEAEGTDADGVPNSATNVLVRLNDDTYTWQSTERTSDGEPQPDLPPVKVTRVKAKK